MIILLSYNALGGLVIDEQFRTGYQMATRGRTLYLSKFLEIH